MLPDASKTLNYFQRYLEEFDEKNAELNWEKTKKKSYGEHV